MVTATTYEHIVLDENGTPCLRGTRFETTFLERPLSVLSFGEHQSSNDIEGCSFKTKLAR
jgi:hypothetical protein